MLPPPSCKYRRRGEEEKGEGVGCAEAM